MILLSHGPSQSFDSVDLKYDPMGTGPIGGENGNYIYWYLNSPCTLKCSCSVFCCLTIKIKGLGMGNDTFTLSHHPLNRIMRYGRNSQNKNALTSCTAHGCSYNLVRGCYEKKNRYFTVDTP